MQTTVSLPDGFIEQPQNDEKVADTHRYFREVRASLMNGRDALQDLEAHYVAEIERLTAERDHWRGLVEKSARTTGMA